MAIIRKYKKGDKQRPAVWASGPDPVDHAIYKTWATSRAQAHFRNEDWQITWQEYQDFWKPYWHRRGRGTDDLCMTRIDLSGAWKIGNVELITRCEHTARHNSLNADRRGRKKRVLE